MFKFLKKRKPKSIERNFNAGELDHMKTQPYGVSGNAEVEGLKFQFHDARSFHASYEEIIKDKIYQFDAHSKIPVIIDCGANMGLSVYYFSKAYPAAKIIAFEPEEAIFKVLQNNVNTYGLKNVTLHQKAVWDERTTLNFFTDKGMGGSVTNVYKKQEPAKVETVVMADYLQEKIDFLKMDIEGAEYRVLKSCESLLKNVENIFVEYHSYIDKEQQLDDLLLLLKQQGFRYHLKQSFYRRSPFIDRDLACENMDMAINIFAYRHG
jgi:FkbM family methyltransferase